MERYTSQGVVRKVIMQMDAPSIKSTTKESATNELRDEEPTLNVACDSAFATIDVYSTQVSGPVFVPSSQHTIATSHV